MKLKKLGRYLLFIGLTLFVVLITGMFTNFSWMSGSYAELFPALALFSYLSFCIGLALIFYHAEKAKQKRATRVMVVICLVIFSFGAFSKLMHWPGASVELIMSSLLFSFGTLPLIIKSRYENRKNLLSGRVIALSIADLISVLSILLGLLSRLLHWPGGNLLIATGTTILVGTFILWNLSFRKEVKLRLEAEEKLKDTLRLVEEKHLIIEEKNKEITDSINYAKRIQEAILPSVDFIQKQLPDSFIYYQPKDIVAGDFYWAAQVGDSFLIAAADCTGHGVPGSLVSVVCSNALNRSVKEFGLLEPGKILDKTRELVLESFSAKGEAIKDGMDISLLSIHKDGVTWAGANNPLWYITTAGAQPELKEIMAEKQPIGKTDDPKPFTTHVLNVKKGDLIYLFTDGYADQFGGPKGKKFKYKPFAELLLQNHAFSMQKQQDMLEEVLTNWRGDLERVDDICVIGIRY